MDFQHPIVQSVAVPLTIALLLTGVVGRGRFAAITAAATGAALLLAVLLIDGAPSWPPVSGLHKLPWLLAFGLAAGVLLDLGGVTQRSVLPLAAVLLLAALVWIVWPQAGRLDDHAWAMLVTAGLIGAAIVVSLNSAERRSVNAPAMLVVGGLGLAALAFNAGSLKLFQLAIALAAASGGYALWNWPKPRHAFGAAGVLGVGFSWVVLAVLTLLLTDVRPLSLLALAFVFAAGPIVRRVPPERWGQWDRHFVEPLVIALLAASALVVALLLGAAPAALPAADDPYYR